MNHAEISTGYKPRPFQAKLHRKLKRFNVLVCHRRFGKTVFSVNHTLDKGLRCPLRNPQYAYVAPTYGQAKRIVWDMLKEYTKNIPNVTTHEQDLRLEIQRPHMKDKVRIMLLGAENPGSIRGIYLDGVVLDEYAECDPTVWSSVLRPALSDRMGWATFIGTPKGQNHFFDVHQTALKNLHHDWYTAIYKASETKVIDPLELAAAKREMSPEEYEQEFECSFSAALVGSYYGKTLELAEEEGRIKNVPYDTGIPVDTYWDLGIGDTTAIWMIQQSGLENRCIDYYEQSGMELSHYAKVLQDRKYVYRDHILPHDAAQRSIDTGRSRAQTLRRLLGNKVYVLPRHNLADGIEASRRLLAKTWFDRIKCERGLNALRNYTRKWDGKNKIWSLKPVHNWASNGSDAFRCCAMGNKEDSSRRNFAHSQTQVADYGYDIYGG